MSTLPLRPAPLGTRPTLTREDLVKDLRALGVGPCMTLLVHSAIRSIGTVHGKALTVRDALVDALTPFGTLIVPTYTFAFCHGADFVPDVTPSEMGALSECVRRTYGAVRIDHPIYSFALLGERARTLARLTYGHDDSFGRDSLLRALPKWGAYILSIGLEWNDFWTQVHAIEQQEWEKDKTLVPYRHMVNIRGYGMFARRLDAGVMTAVNPMGQRLEEAGVVRLGHVGDAPCKLFSAREAARLTAEALREQDGKPGLFWEQT